MPTKWTSERRKRQAQLIQQWQPWKQSTGPKTEQGKAVSARNAYKGNVRGQIKAIRALLKEQLKQFKNDL